MTEFLTIRGTVRGRSYEAALRRAQWPLEVVERAGEWHVNAAGVPTFTIAAGQGRVYEANARVAIETELERRLTR